MSNSDTNENLPHTHDEDPTELLFLETVLADAVDSFTSRIRIFEPIVNDLLLRLSTDEEFSDANLVHQMAPLMEQLKSFEIFVTQAYDCLTQLLNDDEAMLQLLLTEQEGKRIDVVNSEVFAANDFYDINYCQWSREFSQNT